MNLIEELHKPFGYSIQDKDINYASQKEAFWAILFDQVLVEFLYEPSGQNACPDFYFPDLGCYGECKPDYYNKNGQIIRANRNEN